MVSNLLTNYMRLASVLLKETWATSLIIGCSNISSATLHHLATVVKVVLFLSLTSSVNETVVLECTLPQDYINSPT